MKFLNKKWVRIIISATLTLILLFICTYYNHHNPWLSLDTCLENPEKYDGCTINSFQEPLIGEIHADGFILKQKNQPDIKVYADTSDLISNKYIGLVAIYHKEGHLEAKLLKVSENRRYKIWLSIIPTIIVLFLFTRLFRWDWKNWIWRARNA